MLDRFLDAGGTFVDTADTYIDGASEETLRPWLARHRDEVVLATKVRFPVSDPGGQGLAADRIVRACDASLRRMGVDVIDLYQIHAPDPDVPLEETLEALDGLVRAGKVRALGVSNFPAWLLAWAVATQDREGWAPFVSLQPQYSLVERSIEVEILPSAAPRGSACSRGARSARASSPASTSAASARPRARGSPTRTRRSRRPTTVARSSGTSPWSTRPGAIAEERGATIAQVALAWLLGTPGVTAPIVGPRTFAQLEDLLGADGLRLTGEERARLEGPAGPPPMYPQRFLLEQNGIGDVAQVRRARAVA